MGLDLGHAKHGLGNNVRNAHEEMEMMGQQRRMTMTMATTMKPHDIQ